MKFGYFGLNVGTFQHPDAIARLVVAAEQLNFESVWTGEHVVLVDPQVPPSPAPPHSTFVDTVASQPSPQRRRPASSSARASS